MHKYEMIVYWSEDDASFIVEVPELPGCMADGATAVDALINAEQLKSLLLILRLLLNLLF